MWGITVSYITVFKDTLTAGKCVCARVRVRLGREWKHSLPNSVIHAVTLATLNVAHIPQNILKIYKDADRLYFQLSCLFWGCTLSILISFVVHICLSPVNLSIGIHGCIFIFCLHINTCSVLHSLYPKSYLLLSLTLLHF